MFIRLDLPKVTGFPRILNGKANYYYNLTCNISAGDPRPTINWFRNGKLINAAKEHEIKLYGLNNPTLMVSLRELTLLLI